MAGINTAKVTDRRKIRFDSMDDLLADIERIVAADRDGNLRRTGNWTAGQALGHVATWIDYAYEGYPFHGVPWFVKLILKLKKKSYLQKGMQAGIRIPKTEGGTYGTQALKVEEGADRLRKALARLKSGEPARFESPAWGKMPYNERVALNLRHAELHLSFLHPGSA